MKQPINEQFFKPVLDYNKAHKDHIYNICEPLKHLGITNFAYTRVFNGGRYLSISNSQQYQESVFCYDYPLNTAFFRKQTQFFSKYEPYALAWPDNTDDELIEKCHTQGIHNGFNIVQENAGTFEFYFFGADKNSLLIENFYTEHLSLLEKFTYFFQKMASDLLTPLDLSKQGTLPYIRDTFPHVEDVFEKTTPWEKEILKFNGLLNSKIRDEIFAIGKKHSLTRQELKCLSHLSTGKTAKEIARILAISPRTVETHMNKLRLKTLCQTKSELNRWFEDTFHLFLKEPSFKGVIFES